LKQRMPLHYIPSNARYLADGLHSVEQILHNLRAGEAAGILAKKDQATAEETRRSSYAAKIENITKAAQPFPDGSFGTGHLSKVLRSVCPVDTIWAVEAVTNTGFIHDNVRPTKPGSWINCGGGGLGWSGGGALGIKLATDAEGEGQFVCQIVGDGTYLFSMPSSVYWISKRYNIPILTIVLNNDGTFYALGVISLGYVNTNFYRVECTKEVVYVDSSQWRSRTSN
jgi:thiamine pyrophosphate-dependent acetolactate synthase large subunit-like protein